MANGRRIATQLITGSVTSTHLYFIFKNYSLNRTMMEEEKASKLKEWIYREDLSGSKNEIVMVVFK